MAIIYILPLVFQLVTAGWNDWTGWTSCSATCGKGYHVRSRVCEYNPCVGDTTEAALCNEGPCPTESPVVTCPNGWHVFGTSCYHLSKDPESFTSAMTMCSFLKGHLVEIEDQAENTFLTQLMQSFTDNNSTHLWIGLTDVAEEGIFKWMQTKQEPGYKNWKSDEPNNYHDDENCVVMTYFGTWDDNSCHNDRSYICEKPGST